VARAELAALRAHLRQHTLLAHAGTAGALQGPLDSAASLDKEQPSVPGAGPMGLINCHRSLEQDRWQASAIGEAAAPRAALLMPPSAPMPAPEGAEKGSLEALSECAAEEEEERAATAAAAGDAVGGGGGEETDWGGEARALISQLSDDALYQLLLEVGHPWSHFRLSSLPPACLTACAVLGVVTVGRGAWMADTSGGTTGSEPVLREAPTVGAGSPRCRAPGSRRRGGAGSGAWGTLCGCSAKGGILLQSREVALGR
jgi:hypothetical protein